MYCEVSMKSPEALYTFLRMGDQESVSSPVGTYAYLICSPRLVPFEVLCEHILLRHIKLVPWVIRHATSRSSPDTGI